MKRITVSGNRLLFISLLLTTLLVTSPAWSASGKKSAAKNSPAGVVLNQEDNKSVLDKKDLKSQNDDKGVQDSKDLKNGKKDGKSVKKKAVKKAGTAAAVGAAGKKVTSTIQK